MKTKVTTTLKGKENLAKLKKDIKDLHKHYVTVGIHQDAGNYTQGATPPSVVEVALWNEFGTESIPERSFFRSTLTEQSSQINKIREEAVKNILTKGWSVDKALDMIGFRVQVMIQNKIKSNIPPENAPSVLEKKRAEGVGTNTLMETQLLLRSVTYRVQSE